MLLYVRALFSRTCHLSVHVDYLAELNDLFGHVGVGLPAPGGGPGALLGLPVVGIVLAQVYLLGSFPSSVRVWYDARFETLQASFSRKTIG